MMVMPTKDFVMAACSRKHTFFITVNGSLLAAGTASAGELGVYPDKSSYVVDTPMPVHGISRVSDVATADEHTVAIHYDTYELYGWGNQLNGRLGLGNNSQATVNSAKLIPIMKDGNKAKFTGVACGKDFSVALDNEGFIWFAGVKRHELNTSSSSSVLYLEGTKNLQESNTFTKLQEKGKKYEYVVATSTFPLITDQKGNIVLLGDKKVMHSSEYVKKIGESKIMIGFNSVMDLKLPETPNSLIPGLSVTCHVEIIQQGIEHCHCLSRKSLLVEQP